MNRQRLHDDNRIGGLVLALMILLGSCQQPAISTQQSDTVFTVKNGDASSKIGDVLSISAAAVLDRDKSIDWGKVSFVSGEVIPHQYVDDDGDGVPELILLALDVQAGEEKQVRIVPKTVGETPGFAKRTQAEISRKVGGEWQERKYIGGAFQNVDELIAPAEHTDHSEFIRYEGPGWESDKVGYRFYLDWRNAVDIFGKKTSNMILQEVGQDGFDSYHEPAEWGMDVLKVGKSLGIGAIGFWEDERATRIEKTSGLSCTILQNGNLQSKIRTIYSDWEINGQALDLTSDLTIQAGSRLTRQDITISSSLPNICTGIVKHEAGEVLAKTEVDDDAWGYLATYGVQSLAEDRLGMAIFFKGKDLIIRAEDEHSHIVVLQPGDDQQLTYYFAAAWEQELDGIKTLDAFQQYLNETAAALSNAPQVSFD